MTAAAVQWAKHDRNRTRVAIYLREHRGAYVGAIATACRMSEKTARVILNELATAKLVTAQRIGGARNYTLNDGGQT